MTYSAINPKAYLQNVVPKFNFSYPFEYDSNSSPNHIFDSTKNDKKRNNLENESQLDQNDEADDEEKLKQMKKIKQNMKKYTKLPNLWSAQIENLDETQSTDEDESTPHKGRCDSISSDWEFL